MRSARHSFPRPKVANSLGDRCDQIMGSLQIVKLIRQRCRMLTPSFQGAIRPEQSTGQKTSVSLSVPHCPDADFRLHYHLTNAGNGRRMVLSHHAPFMLKRSLHLWFYSVAAIRTTHRCRGWGKSTSTLYRGICFIFFGRCKKQAITFSHLLSAKIADKWYVVG